MYRFFKRNHILVILFCAPLSALIAREAVPRVDFDTALAQAIETDPVLRSLETAAEAAEGQVEQAGQRPNPVVGIELENFLGSGPFRDVKGAEVTLGISQLIETAGKRTKRMELARTERLLVDWERELQIASVESDVRQAFVVVLLAQDTLELRKEQLALSERSEEETAKLVEAARSNQVELTRARLAVRQQAFAVNQAQRSLEAARARLAAFWSEPADSGYAIVGSVEIEPQLPALRELTALLSDSAYLAQYEGHSRKREAALRLEEARAKPDFEVFGGARYVNEASGDAALVVGIDIPWPLFDKNQGNIRSARARLRAVEFEKAETRRELMIALTDAYQQLRAAHEEVISVREDLLPAAEQTLVETEAGYERGQFTLLSVLESRNTLFEIREIHLDALNRYASAQVQIEALTRPSTR